MAITRDEVLHVAKLARLDLSEDEVERLTVELDAILEAVSKVAELDLADVPPDLAPARRRRTCSPTTSRTSRSRSATRSRTRPRARATCSASRRPPDAARRGHAAAHGGGGARSRRAEGAAAGRAARGLPRRDRRRATASCTRTCARSSGGGSSIPIALKDVISTKGVETTAGSRILVRATYPCSTRQWRRGARRRGSPCSARRTPTSSRWALPPRTRRGGRRATRGIRRACPAAPAAVPRPPSLPDSPRGGSGSDTGGSIKQPSRSVRQRRAAADVRHRLALRRRRLRLEPRPDRAGGEDGARRRAPLLDHRRPRPRRLDHGRAARAGAAAGRGAARRPAHRHPAAARGVDCDRLGRARRVRALDRARARARRRGRGVRPAALVRLRHGVLLPDRPGRGVFQPRPL